jgi:serine/threonine protein kinase
MRKAFNPEDSTLLCKLIREVSVHNYVSNFGGPMNLCPKLLAFEMDKLRIHMENGGSTFSQYRFDLTRTQVLILLYKAAIKFGYYYSLGLLHGDISASNILFDHLDQDVRLIDFGSSTFELNSGMYIIQAIIFCSPELLRAKILSVTGAPALISLSVSSEIWSYGIIAYLMLSRAILPEDKDGRLTLANYQQLFGQWSEIRGISLPAPTFRPLQDCANLSETDTDFLRLICQFDPRARPRWKEIIMHPIFNPVRNTVNLELNEFMIGRIDVSIERPFYSQIVNTKVTNRHPRVTSLLMGKGFTLTQLSVAKSIINSCEVEPNMSAVMDMTRCLISDTIKDNEILINISNIQTILAQPLSLVNVCSLFTMFENEYVDVMKMRRCLVAVYLLCEYSSYVDVVRDACILLKDIRDAAPSGLGYRLWRRVCLKLFPDVK